MNLGLSEYARIFCQHLLFNAMVNDHFAFQLGISFEERSFVVVGRSFTKSSAQITWGNRAR